MQSLYSIFFGYVLFSVSTYKQIKKGIYYSWVYYRHHIQVTSTNLESIQINALVFPPIYLIASICTWKHYSLCSSSTAILIEQYPSTDVSIMSLSTVVIYSARTSPVHWIILVCYSAMLEGVVFLNYTLKVQKDTTSRQYLQTSSLYR